MSAVVKLAWKSLMNRKATAILTIMTVAISVVLLLGVERIRTQAKDSFANTISGTDLIIGGRSGQVNLLLYSVFRIGNATNNIDWKSYQEFANHRSVDWAIPISLGDSHKGFRVMGTNHSYFEHYKFGSKQPLTFSKGREFHGLFETVLGSDVAKQLGYDIGSEIIIAHGISDVGFSVMTICHLKLSVSLHLQEHQSTKLSMYHWKPSKPFTSDGKVVRVWARHPRHKISKTETFSPNKLPLCSLV